MGSYYRLLIPLGLAILALLTLILVSCAVGPDFKPLPPPQAQQYTKLPMPLKTASTPQYFVSGRDLGGDWWQIFHSSKLNDLITAGLNNNQDLAAAKAALREANYALYAQIGGLLLPAVNFSGGAQESQSNALSFGVNTPSTTFNVFNASFQASYLLDVWGASRRQIEAYAAQADYERYVMLGTYITLTTNIATTAITIASLQDQLIATNNLIVAQKKVLKITQQQFSAGGVSETNVLSQQTLLAQTQATLPPLQKSLSEEQHALAVLTGNQTSDMPILLLNLNKIKLPRELPVSLPSQLVESRPDIQASEALLHATSAQVGVATANLLPQITLTGNYGWISSSANNLFSSANQTWNIGAGLLQPLFHGGQLIMQRKSMIAAFEQARAQYKQTVLQAFKNVADALRAIQYDAVEMRDQVRAEKFALETLNITEQQYQVGGQNYLAVLNAQEQYQNSVLARVKAQAMRYTDTAALYQALGGGWWNDTISQYGTTRWGKVHT